MSRLSIETPGRAETVVEGLYRDVERRISASPPGLCPVDMALSFLRLSHAQTCGKCVPCRIGLGQLTELLESVLDSTATPETIDLIEKTARVIQDTADCAIGYEAARMVLQGVQGSATTICRMLSMAAACSAGTIRYPVWRSALPASIFRAISRSCVRDVIMMRFV